VEKSAVAAEAAVATAKWEELGLKLGEQEVP